MATATSGKPSSLSDSNVAERLLSFLQRQTGSPALAYAEPPRRLTGGYDTAIYAFTLAVAPDAFTGPLILRLLRPGHDASRALREKAVHDQVTGLGYPAPRVPFATSDTATLGGAFMVMERIAGKPLLEAQPLGIARALAEAQVRLHALPAPATLSGAPDDGLTLQGHIDRLDTIVNESLPGLRTGMDWLLANVPKTAGETVICHGDFHPLNILSDGKQVTGVIDWPNAVLGPPEFDVAATLVIARLSAPQDVSPLERILLLLRPLLAKRYLAIYRKLSGRDLGGLETFEALACMRNLVDEGRRAVEGLGPGAWNHAALIRRFHQITGTTVSLPGFNR